jgi:hypothetical protein
MKKRILLVTGVLALSLCACATNKEENVQETIDIFGQNDEIKEEGEDTVQSPIETEKQSELEEISEVIETKEIDGQEQFSNEKVSQEYTNTSEDAVTKEDTTLLDKINKNKIKEQSFSVALNDWGKVMFVSCMPDFDDDIAPLTDVSFYLIDDKNVVYQFPYVAQDNVRESGLYEGVSFVFFDDINADGKDDIVIGCSYVSGAGPQGMIPYTEVRIYEDDVDKFIYDKEFSEKINESLPQDATADDVKKRILNILDTN